MRSGNANTFSEDIYSNRTKEVKKQTSDIQAKILNKMRIGWTLYQDRHAFNFYMKKDVPDVPFTIIRGELYNPSVKTLINSRLVKKIETPYPQDYKYELVERG